MAHSTQRISGGKASNYEEVTDKERYAKVKEPLYTTGNEAADAGIKGVKKPKKIARKTIEKIKKAKAAKRIGRKRLGKWFKEANNRRHDLINKEFKGGGLTSKETTELEALQKKVVDEVNRVHPLPIAHLEKLEKQLRRLGKTL